MRRAPRVLLTFLSGVAFALAYPKASVWPLAFFALIPLLRAMSDPHPADPPPVLSGFLWGAGFFGSLLSWFYVFFRHYGRLSAGSSIATLAILVGYLAVYPGLFAHYGSVLLQRYRRGGWLLLPPLWVALEWIRARALTGFPWGLAGYSLAPCLPLIQVASIAGVYGVSFLVVLVNVAGAASLNRRAISGRWAATVAAAAAGILAGAFAAGSLSAKVPQGPSVPVGLVQAAIPQDEKWSSEAAEEILEEHERLTTEAAHAGARLVLWPESSSPFPISGAAGDGAGRRVRPNRAYRERLESLSGRLNVPILFGTVDYREADGGVRPVNAAALVRPDGSWAETYAKMHLVPFGEYVPLGRLLSFVNRVVEGAIGDFLPGGKAVVVESGGLRVGTAICYEMIFPELIRRFPLEGAEVLANLTNDAWFGTSSGPYQHFDMARFRAVESRRYLVRSANTGISGIVDPRGAVVLRSQLGESRALIGSVVPLSGLTPYARVGDLFAIVCVILACAALAACFIAGGRVRGEELGGTE